MKTIFFNSETGKKISNYENRTYLTVSIFMINSSQSNLIKQINIEVFFIIYHKNDALKQ